MAVDKTINGLTTSEHENKTVLHDPKCLAHQSSSGSHIDHSYAIIKAAEFRGKRFLKIRNPWGTSEWTGRWSDGSKEWTKEWLDALGPLEHTFGDDGVFVMEYGDFLNYWDAVERTQLFDESWCVSCCWVDVRGREETEAWMFGDVSCMSLFPLPLLYAI